MKLVFLIQRINSYKFYYSIIKEALARGMEVECWNYNGAEKGKEYLVPGEGYQQNFAPFSHPKIKAYDSTEILNKLLLEDQSIDFVFILNRPEMNFDEALLSQATFKWVVLMGTGPDSFLNLSRKNKSPIASKRRGFLLVSTIHWKDKGKLFFERFLPHLTGLLEDKSIKTNCVGQPEFDTCSKIDPGQVRSKYKIPQDKSVFLYLPYFYYLHGDGTQWSRAYCGFWTNRQTLSDSGFAMNRFGNSFRNILRKGYHLYKIMRDPLARNWFLRGIHEGKVIEAIKKFCQMNNLFLVIKPRLKYLVSTPVQKAADLIVWDTEKDQNPSVLKELLSVSKVAASQYSHSVLTAAFMNVFHLNLVPPKEYFLNYGDPPSPEMNRYWLSEAKPSIFSFDRVCDSWSIENVIEKLPQTSLEEFTIDPGQRDEYVKKFIGYDDFNSCKRILDILENDFAKETFQP